MWAIEPYLNPKPSGRVLSRPNMTLTSKIKLLVSMVTSLEYPDLNPILQPSRLDSYLHRPSVILTSTSKLLVSWFEPQIFHQTLTLIANCSQLAMFLLCHRQNKSCKTMMVMMMIGDLQ